MVIDFDESNVKKIDSVVFDFLKVCSGQYTRGQMRSFIVNLFLTEVSDFQLREFVISKLRCLNE